MLLRMNHYYSELVMVIGALVYVLPGSPPAPPDGSRMGRLQTMGLVAFGVGLLVSLWHP